MNLLIIGNGFDLAHGLPTSYTDFLKFVNEANDYYNNFYPKYKDVTKKDKEGKEFFNYFIELNKNDDFKYITELCKLSSNNLWFSYFNKHLKNIKENWIDFESEISKVVKFLDDLNKKKELSFLENNDKSFNETLFFKRPFFEMSDNETALLLKYFAKFFNYFDKLVSLKKFSNDTFIFYVDGFQRLLDIALMDLNNLIRCLEIYLSKYVNNLETNLRIPEIFKMRDKINYVLSFNYTNTFERLYARPDVCKVFYDYIHGKANIENTVDDCQLVLGIDEYLDEEERNKNIDFIQYKKYFQRIYKKTGLIHVSWLKSFNDCYNITRNEDLKEINIHIVGHSLDITDKDILKNIIMFDKQENRDNKPTIPVNVTIYDHNKNASASHIANLVRVITQEELIKGVYGEDGKDPKIVFKPQSPSININGTEDQ